MKFEPTILPYLDTVVRLVKEASTKGAVEISSYSKYFTMDVNPAGMNVDRSYLPSWRWEIISIHWNVKRIVRLFP
jgi:hypothetical protein